MRLLTVVLAACAIAVPAASAARSPTPAELQSVKASLVKDGGLYGFSFMRVSTVDRHYVSIHYFAGSPNAAIELRRENSHRWSYVYGFTLRQRGDGACAFAAASVIRDLLELRCPAAAALHARRATIQEKSELTRVFRASPLTRRWTSGRLEKVCVSRLDASAAAALIAFPSTAGVVWFRRSSGSWSPLYETVGRKGVRPSAAIVLSLASCVGYNAAQYGG